MMNRIKKLVSVTILILSSNLIFSQAWTDVGLKIGTGVNLLINENIFNDNTVSQTKIGALSYGAKAGINIGLHSSITFDFMLSKLNQDYKYVYQDLINGTTNGTVSFNWSNQDLYFLYRNSQHKMYFEVGGLLSRIQGVKQSDSFYQLPEDVTDKYTNQYWSGVLGFGGYISSVERFNIILGLRFHYALQDLVANDGITERYPLPIFKDRYVDYTPSNPLLVELVVEFNFGVGYFAKEACSQRIGFFQRGYK